jgi:hypothetical protein
MEGFPVVIIRQHSTVFVFWWQPIGNTNSTKPEAPSQPVRDRSRSFDPAETHPSRYTSALARNQAINRRGYRFCWLR